MLDIPTLLTKSLRTLSNTHLALATLGAALSLLCDEGNPAPDEKLLAPGDVVSSVGGTDLSLLYDLCTEPSLLVEKLDVNTPGEDSLEEV